MLTAIILILYAAVAVLDLLPMLKKRQSKKETVVYCVLLSVSLCVLVLYSFDIDVPGPSEPIRALVEKLVPAAVK